MFENGNEPMAIFAADGSVERTNAALRKRFGFATDLSGERFDRLVAVEDRYTANRAFSQALSGKSNEFSAAFLDARNQRVPVVVTLSPIVEAGRVAGVAGAARDVSADQAYEEQLLRNRERLSGLFEQNFYAMAAIKLDGTLSAVNVAMERLSGYRNEEVVGKPATILTPADRRDLEQRRLAELSVSPAPMSYESTLLCRGDHELHIEVDILPIEVSGKTEGYYMTIKDLTEERALRSRLGEKDARVSALYRVASSGSNPSLQIDEALVLGMTSLNMRYGLVTEVSGGTFTVRHRCGPEDGLMPVGYAGLVTPEIGGRLLENPRAVAQDDLSSDAPWKSFIGSRIVADGDPYGAMVFLDTEPRARRFEAADSDFIVLLATLTGGAVSRELAMQRLEEGSLSDALTGLANRTLLEQNIRRAIATAGRRQRKFAVLFVDLDRFKPINDERGHATGDLVLKEVATRLKEALRAEDLVARAGGDEFVILQTDLDRPEATRELADRVTAALSRPMNVAGLDVQIGCSIGIAAFPADGKTPEDLLSAADASMYREKARNRGPA
jgi:diguanylate cyclase (GGDEF)-like protein/PAS domain S-box-containing protein